MTPPTPSPVLQRLFPCQPGLAVSSILQKKISGNKQIRVLWVYTPSCQPTNGVKEIWINGNVKINYKQHILKVRKTKRYVVAPSYLHLLVNCLWHQTFQLLVQKLQISAFIRNLYEQNKNLCKITDQCTETISLVTTSAINISRKYHHATTSDIKALPWRVIKIKENKCIGPQTARPKCMLALSVQHMVTHRWDKQTNRWKGTRPRFFTFRYEHGRHNKHYFC